MILGPHLNWETTVWSKNTILVEKHETFKTKWKKADGLMSGPVCTATTVLPCILLWVSRKHQQLLVLSTRMAASQVLWEIRQYYESFRPWLQLLLQQSYTGRFCYLGWIIGVALHPWDQLIQFSVSLTRTPYVDYCGLYYVYRYQLWLWQ